MEIKKAENSKRVDLNTLSSKNIVDFSAFKKRKSDDSSRKQAIEKIKERADSLYW